MATNKCEDDIEDRYRWLLECCKLYTVVIELTVPQMDQRFLDYGLMMPRTMLDQQMHQTFAKLQSSRTANACYRESESKVESGPGHTARQRLTQKWTRSPARAYRPSYTNSRLDHEKLACTVGFQFL